MAKLSLLQRAHPGRRARGVSRAVDIALGAAAIALACMILAVLLGGCAARSATRVEGANASASHETRSERPGRTIERSIELRVDEPRPKTAPDSQVAPSGSTSQTPFTSPVNAPCGPRAPLASIPVEPAIVLVSARAPRQDDASRDAWINAARGMLDEARDTGSPVTLTLTEREYIPPSADTATSSVTDAAPSLRTDSADAAVGFKGSVGRFALPWSGKAGGGKWGISAELVGGRGVNALMVIGGLMLAGAVVPLVVKPRRFGLAATLAGAGLVIIASGVVAEQYPWLLAIALVVFIGVLGYLAYEAWRAGRLRVSLASVVRGVEHAPNSKAVKDTIEVAAGEHEKSVRAEVSAAKRRANVKEAPAPAG